MTVPPCYAARAWSAQSPASSSANSRHGAIASGQVRAKQVAEPGMLDKMMSSPAFKSAMRSAGTVIGREITRSIFGTGRRRKR